MNKQDIKSYAKGNIIYFVGNTAYLFAQWLISIIIVRVTGYAEAGVFSLVMTTSNLVFMIMSYGMRTFQVSDVIKKYSNNQYMYSRVVTSVLGTILLLGYLVIMRYSLNVNIAIMIYVLFKVCEAFSDVTWGIMQTEDVFEKAGRSLLLKGIFNFIAFMALYLTTKSLNLGLLSMMLSSFALLVIYDLRSIKKFISTTWSGLVSEIKKVFALLKETFVLMLYALCSPLFVTIPRVILEKMHGEEILGFFSSVYTPTVIIASLTSCILIPLVSKNARYYLNKEYKKLKISFLIPIGATLAIGALAYIASVLLGKWALGLVFGEEIVQYADLLNLSIISITFTSLTYCVGYFLTAIRKLKENVIFSLLINVLCLIFSLLMIKDFSLYGAAYAQIISQGIIIIVEAIYVVCLFKKMSTNKRELNLFEVNMKRVIITGATGMIGIALTKLLISKNIEVAAVVRPNSNRINRIPNSPLVKVVECDVNNLSELPNMLEGTGKYDVLFHFAWGGTFGDARNDMDLQIMNIKASVDAVNAASKLGCETFLGAGSQAEYGRINGEKLSATTQANPENGYGIAKLCSCQMSRVLCNSLNIKHIWTRILSIYGENDAEYTMIMSAISKMLKGEQTNFTKGEQLWDYLHCDDAANALYLAALNGKPNSVYPIGSGNAKPLAEYIMEIRDSIDQNIILGIGNVPYSENQVMYLCADIETISADTGFTPQISFSDGIKRTIDWYRENYL